MEKAQNYEQIAVLDSQFWKKIQLKFNLNGQAFDHQFILNYILQKTDIKPELIQRGPKIIFMQIQNKKFIYSLNSFPMALSKLPKAFDLKPTCSTL